MKKSLVIISFAFIFLLSMSIVSASWFSDLFDGSSTGVSTNRVSLRSSGSSSTSFCPRGWTQIFYSLNGKENKCCVPSSGGTDGGGTDIGTGDLLMEFELQLRELPGASPMRVDNIMTKFRDGDIKMSEQI